MVCENWLSGGTLLVGGRLLALIAENVMMQGRGVFQYVRVDHKEISF
jgi:hypothetical protein